MTAPDGFAEWVEGLRPSPEPDCQDAWHFDRMPYTVRQRKHHDERRQTNMCPSCHWEGSGWLCKDCGHEIAAQEIAFRPRCISCHVTHDGRIQVERAQERIEQDCFDERADQAAALAHHQRILEELAG